MRQRSLTATASAVQGYGGRCLTVGADLGDPADRATIVPRVIAEFGRIDVLINNAAAAIYGSPVTYSDKRRRLTMEVNFFAPFDLTQAVIPPMVERGEGWVVNLTSGAATHKPGPPFDSPLETGIYGASKAALDRMTNAMGVALYGTGVRVNAVRPGLILTDIHDAAPPGRIERLLPGVPMARVGTAHEVAEAIVWLASDASSYVSGTFIDVGGAR